MYPNQHGSWNPFLAKFLSFAAILTLLLSMSSLVAISDEGLNTGFTDEYWQKVRRAKNIPEKDSGNLIDRAPVVPPRNVEDSSAPSQGSTGSVDRINEVRANQIAREIAREHAQDQEQRRGRRGRNHGPFVIIQDADFPGGDYKNFSMDPTLAIPADACRAACEADSACCTYVMVPAGIQGEKPMCWLKSVRVSERVSGKTGFFAGLKRSCAKQPVPTPPGGDGSGIAVVPPTTPPVVLPTCPSGTHYVQGKFNDPCGKPFFGCYPDSGPLWGTCESGRQWTSSALGCGCAPTPTGGGTGILIPVTPSPIRYPMGSRGNAQGYTIYENIDFPGNDLGAPIHLYSADPHLCATQCNRQPGCVGFTFVDGDPSLTQSTTQNPMPKCWLKGQMPGSGVANPHTVSGRAPVVASGIVIVPGAVRTVGSGTATPAVPSAIASVSPGVATSVNSGVTARIAAAHATTLVPGAAVNSIQAERSTKYSDAKIELASRGASCRNWDTGQEQAYCKLVLRDPSNWTCPSGSEQTDLASPYCIIKPSAPPADWRNAKGCGEFKHAGIDCNRFGVRFSIPFDGLERITRAESDLRTKGPHCRNWDAGQQQAYCRLAVRDRATWSCPSGYQATSPTSAYCLKNPSSLPVDWEKAKGCGEFTDNDGLDCNKVGFRFWEDVAARDARENNRVQLRDKMCWARHLFNFRTCWVKPMQNGACSSDYKAVPSMGKCVKWANQDPGLDNCQERFGIAINETCLSVGGSPSAE